jgi:predicted metalloprotease
MTNMIARLGRPLGLSLLLSVTTVVTASAAAPAPARTGPEPTNIVVTQADVDKSNSKLNDVYGVLVDVWTNDFRQMGRRFVAPQLLRYRGNVRTPCGVMSANNAAYCGNANAIFYDEIFIAGQVKMAGRALNTDGDMAGIGIIAHEMGHAVAAQLGLMSRSSYENEAMADCLSGYFAKASEKNLEAGDLDEAFTGLAAAGDPELQLTGNPRIDDRRVARLRAMAHGTGEQRMANFKAGFSSGTQACFQRSRQD